MTNSIVARGVFVPVGILVLAFAVFLTAGEHESLGPLDLATAQWLVIGIWCVAPVFGGLASRGLSGREINRGATILGTTVGLVVALVFLTAAGTDSSCQSSGGSSALGYVGGCLVVGAIVGIGMGASLFLVARLAGRSSWLLAIVFGSLVSFGTGWLAFVLYYSNVTCLR